MANGYTPGSFTPRAGGKSYTEMLGEQVQSIRADRQQRLDRAFNRNQAERQLKSQRMSTVLNIDTTGMAPEYAQSLNDFKSSIIESLDSSSDTYYGDGEVGDAKFMVEVANLVQAKNASDGHYQIGSNGAEGYTNSFGKVDAATGRPYVGNKEDLDARSQMWDSGLFENMGVTGEVGSRQITGIPLNPITINPETKAYESVRISENAIPIGSHELLLDATPFWTAPTGDAPMISDTLALDFTEGGAYASLLNTDVSGDLVINKEDGIARSAFRTDGVLNDMRQEWLRENAGKPVAKGITTIDQWDDDRWAIVGLSEELAFKKFQEIGNSVAENRAVEFNDKSFIGQGQYPVGDVITYSIFDQKTQKSRTITVASEGEQRKVSFVGLDGTDPTTASFVYVYDLGDNVLQTATIPVNSGEGRQIVEGIGGESALAALVDRVPIPVNTDGQNSDQPNNQNNQQQGEEEEVSETQPVDVQSNLEASRVELEYEIQQIEGELQNIPPERRDLARIDRLQQAKRELAEVNQRLSGVQENPESYTSNEDFESYLSEVKDSISFFSRNTPAQNLAKEISGLTPPEQDKAINQKYDEIEAEWNSISNNLDTPRKKVKASELETQMAQLEEMRNRLGYSENKVIQGEGPGIAYSKPRPPQDISILEVGNSAAGSSKEERKLAFNEATRMAREAGHPFPEVVAAQFAKESSWGKDKGADFNYFGMKSSPAFIERLKEAGIEVRSGDEVETDEYIDGKKKTIKDSFLAFNSPEDAFMAYLMFIDTTKKKGEGGASERRYGEALDESETAYDYIKKIIEAGYATTPPKAYADSINSIAKTYGFDLTEIGRKPVGTASN